MSEAATSEHGAVPMAGATGDSAQKSRGGTTLSHATPILVGCALGAGVSDAVQTYLVVARAGEPVSSGLLAGLVALGIVMAPLVLLSPLLAWLGQRKPLQASGHHLFLALGAGDDRRAPFASLLFCLLAGAAVFDARKTGEVLVGRLGPNVIVSAIVLVTVALLLLTPLLAATIASWTAALLPRATRWSPGPPLVLACAASFVPWMLGVVPAGFVATLGCAILGGTTTAFVLSRPRFAGRSTLADSPILIPALVGVGSLAFVAIPVLPNPVQLAVAFEAPSTSLLLGAVRAAFDRDKDGYSSVLLGGDCNDNNASIHPGAHDIPGNGVDENCSGSDAKWFEPTLQKPGDYEQVMSEPLNVVLIHLDAQRLDHMSLAGYRRNTSPHEDAFIRKHAAWFSQAYTPAASTRFALTSVFTGLDIEKIPQDRGRVMDMTLGDDAITIASILGKYGYSRVGFTNSYTLQHLHKVGLGFEVWKSPWPVNDYDATYVDAAERTTNAALDYLADRGPATPNPYLLFLHYQCTHDPYIKHDKWDYGGEPKDLYDSALSYCDDELGRLLTALENRPDWERTAVVLYSDHGELFGEFGRTGHGFTLSEADTRVLLAMRIPGVSAKEVKTPVTLTDLAPTIVALSGHVPQIPRSESWNLLPVAAGGDAAARMDRPIFLYADITKSGTRTQGRGVVQNRIKYMRDAATSIEGVYRLTIDPTEQHNLASVEPALRAQLADLTDSWDSHATNTIR